VDHFAEPVAVIRIIPIRCTATLDQPNR